MGTADKDSQFWRGTSPPAPSSLDSKLKRLTRWRTLNEHQSIMIRAQHDMQDKRNYSILTITSDNVSFPVSWSANIYTFWIHWCLRMINQLMWHVLKPFWALDWFHLWNATPKFDSCFSRALVMMVFQRGPGSLAQEESSISLESMLPRIYQIKKENTQWVMYTPSLLKWGCIDFKDSFVPTNIRFQVFCLAGNIPWEKLLNVSTSWAGLRRDNKVKSVLIYYIVYIPGASCKKIQEKHV